MKLDHATYEAWLLDRAEGNLSPDQERMLDAFLHAHPDLAVDQEPLPRIAAGTEPFPGKESLLHAFPPSGAPAAARLNEFLAARLEGDLSAEQEKQLGHYLQEHPRAAKDAAAMAMSKVVAAPVPFEGKPRLERHFPPHGLPGTHNLTDFLIAEAEGDLTPNQRNALGQYVLRNPVAQREQRLVLAARLHPTALRFPWKEELLKREVRVLRLWARWAAAASIALLMGAGWWMIHKDTRPRTEIAQSEKLETPPAPEVLPAGQAKEKEPQPEVTDAIVPRKGTSRDLTAARGRSFRPTPVSACNKPEPEEPPHDEPTPEPDPPPPTPPPVREPAFPLASAWPMEHQAPGGRDDVHHITTPAQGHAASNQDLGVYVANKLRGDVLESPQRPTGLDARDMVAVADRAIAAVSSGHGGVQVQRSATRERIRLSLGRNFSISASRAR